MFKRFLNFILMSFKANNVKVGNKKVASPSGEATPSSSTKKSPKSTTPPSVVLNEVETLILLKSLKNSTFKGEMVESVYTLAMKLKNNLDNV